jgi:hypothetical protein
MAWKLFFQIMNWNDLIIRDLFHPRLHVHLLVLSVCYARRDSHPRDTDGAATLLKLITA